MSFKFKQFAIKQENSLMKVGTDGILLGAWATAKSPQTILDVGTGTGLLALMMAQRYPQARVDAIEIDEASALEAMDNTENSPFASRINVAHTALQIFAENTPNRYDLIVSNPPFFNTGLVRNTARHTNALSHKDLIFGVKKMLNEKGQFCLILPKKEGEDFIELAKNYDLYLAEKINVKPKPSKAIERLLLRFSIPPACASARDRQECLCYDELIIEEAGEQRIYTKAYINLTKEFYLNMP